MVSIWLIPLALVSAIFLATQFRATYFVPRATVPEGWFGPLDTSLAVVLSLLFGILSLQLFTKPAVAITEGDVVNSLVFQVIIGLIVVGYIVLRKIPLRDFFGWQREPFLRSLGRSAFLVAGIFPLLILLSEWLSPSTEAQQNTVKFFRDDATLSGRIWLAVMAVVVAPLVEEIIFRGVLYRIFRTYFGRIAALFFTAALFAAIHGNAPTFIPLMLLAIVLTIGLERSGSLMVCILGHAIFNAVSLLLLIYSPSS